MLEIYSKIIHSEEYKNFKKDNLDSYLSSVFLDDKGWQFNFSYGKKIITFYIENSTVKTEESDVYSLNKEVKELVLDNIKISLKDAEKLVNKITEEKKEEITKKIIILQEKEVPFWNLTFITKSLNFINVKINAISGEIMEQKFENILNLKANLS